LLQNLSKMIDRSVHLIDQHSKPIYQLDTDLDFPSRLDGLMNQAAKTAISFSVVASRKTCTLFPVHISEKKGGFLVIGGQIDKADQCTSLTVEQAANVISFSLMKEHALRRHERSIRNDFFLHFLDGTFSSQEEIIGRAIEFSLQTDRKYICAVGKIEGTDYHPTYAERHEKADDIFDFIEGEVTNAVAKIHFFQKREACILLFEVQDNRTNLLTDAKSMLRQFQTRVSSCFENTVSFGISNLCHNFLHVKNAYKEAADALSLGQRSKKKEYIQTYQTKDIMELLRQIPQEDLKNYYSIALNGFTESKIDEEQTLLETLSVYLETHCQISETAKRLFVHRNTVVYRIEKCEEILGKSLKDSETTLQMRLAFRIKLLLTEK
jgi:PucR family transcriptional regulator, purine catabolism regulatory protein